MIALSRPLIGDDERAAVLRVLSSARLVQGEEVAAFEAEFAGVVEGRICVAVSSGTAALHLGLVAAGIGAGDEVVVPSFTFAATANAVRLAGATPIFCDIDRATFCLDPSAVRAAIGARTAAVLAVHLYGQAAGIADLAGLCADRGLLLLEDAAQAHGATLHGRAAGAWGSVSAFSFYATKNMTTGEGGMIVTDDPAVARMARLLRNQGMERRYANEVVGFNARLTDMAAAIGRVQLTRLAGWNARRQAVASAYDRSLRGVTTPAVAPGAVHVYHQYTVRHGHRDALVAALRRRDVEIGIYYPTPVHRLPAFDLRLDLPETERACAEALSLPVGPHLSDEDVSAVVAAVADAESCGSVT